MASTPGNRRSRHNSHTFTRSLSGTGGNGSRNLLDPKPLPKLFGKIWSKRIELGGADLLCILRQGRLIPSARDLARMNGAKIPDMAWKPGPVR